MSEVLDAEVQTSPIRVYWDDGNFDGGWWAGDKMKHVGCTLKALPGMRGKIPFSQSIVRNDYGVPTIFLSFTVSFFGDHGQIGYEFLYSALERSRYWTISSSDDHGFSVTEMWGEQVHIFSRSVIITCASYGGSYHGVLCECINYEILNPKWEKYWDLFMLTPNQVEFITVK